MARYPLIAALLCVVGLSACNKGSETDSSSTTPSDDQDRDGYGAAEDCNDTDPTINPGAIETCDGQDNDCDGAIDENVTSTWYADADGDGYGDPATQAEACDRPTGFVPIGNDCDDTSANAWPGNAETCDGLDNNCDGTVDEGMTVDVYEDADGDGHGNPSVSQTGCGGMDGWSLTADDCDDTNPAAWNDAPEICDGIDNDCDGEIDEVSDDAAAWYHDGDGDGYGDPATENRSCRVPPGAVTAGGDCDDANAAINPGATEICDGIDNDCNSVVDDVDPADASPWYRDADGDGYGDPGTIQSACDRPAGYLADATDCDDTNADINPSAGERCDGIDNDCDGFIDDDPVDGTVFYPDADGDTWGDASSPTLSCTLVAGLVTNALDCDDANPYEPVLVDATTGIPTGDGSAAAPFDTVQAGVDRASGCVLVYPGTYTEQIDLLGKSLRITGTGGSAETILDAALSTCTTTNPADCGAVITMDSGSGATPTIDGFTVKNGTGYTTSSSTTETCGDSMTGYETCVDQVYEYCGGGAYVFGEHPTFHDVIVESNALPPYAYVALDSLTDVWMYSMGGGLCAVDATITLDDVTFRSNTADEGGGIYAVEGSALDATHTVFAENTATDGAGVYLDTSSLTARNSIFACNTATGDGGGLLAEESGADVNLTNLVFYGDTSATGASRGAALFGDTSATFGVWDSIVDVSIEAFALYGQGTGIFVYNDVYNAYSSSYLYGGAWTAPPMDISADPLFVTASCDGDPTNDDFHLSAGSPAIDAGQPLPEHPDPDGSRNDLGAYGGDDGNWD